MISVIEIVIRILAFHVIQKWQFLSLLVLPLSALSKVAIYSMRSLVLVVSRLSVLSIEIPIFESPIKNKFRIEKIPSFSSDAASNLIPVSNSHFIHSSKKNI